ncbi:hypothetical protein EYF80_067163 [Liparis tanakae]|uniref:Uncharacterized protein n=1 Tax=Liparis tanakae TaxID=230148 RepID=A0A4Z2E2W7_9TELE|nr:hypothetical protein EYF80_067163 [Liparis tanakae]
MSVHAAAGADAVAPRLSPKNLEAAETEQNKAQPACDVFGFGSLPTGLTQIYTHWECFEAGSGFRCSEAGVLLR